MPEPEFVLLYSIWKLLAAVYAALGLAFDLEGGLAAVVYPDAVVVVSPRLTKPASPVRVLSKQAHVMIADRRTAVVVVPAVRFAIDDVIAFVTIFVVPRAGVPSIVIVAPVIRGAARMMIIVITGNGRGADRK